MEFIDLTIHGFGKFHDLHISFAPGMNVIYGHNEAGKTTLHAFIHSMLFGLEKKPGLANRSSLYRKYEPWEDSGEYGGELRFRYNGQIYRMIRVFEREKQSLTIYSETERKKLDGPEEFLKLVRGGMTETAFSNTVSIGQLKCETSRSMVQELKNYIRSMNTTGDLSLDADSALELLRSQQAAYREKLVPEAAKTYSSLIGEIRNIEREISQPEYENQLLHFEKLRDTAKQSLSEKLSGKEALIQKIAQEEQTLKLSGFSTDTEIREAAEKASAVYADYNEGKKEMSRRGRILFPVIMVLLSFISLAGAAVSAAAGSAEFAAAFHLSGLLNHVPGINALFLQLPMQPSVLVGLGAILFVLFLFFAVLMIIGNLRAKQRFSDAAFTLHDNLSLQLGNGEISDGAMQAYAAHMEELIRVYGDLLKNRSALEQLNGELNQLSDTEKSCDDALTKQHEKQAELEEKLTHLTNVKNRAEQLKRTLSENDQVTQEIDAVSLAIETITDLKKNIRTSFGHYLNKEAGDLISGITGGVYDSMWIDENLGIYMNTPSRLVPIEDVSSGTMDQIYLSLRLAAARLLQKNAEELMPLIFDDSFAMYDEDRLKAALGFISSVYAGQILLFTCHKREARLLEEAGQRFNKIEM